MSFPMIPRYVSSDPRHELVLIARPPSGRKLQIVGFQIINISSKLNKDLELIPTLFLWDLS